MQIIGIIVIVLLAIIIFCLDYISKTIPNTKQISSLLEGIGSDKEKDYTNSYTFKKIEEDISDIKIILEKFTQIDIDVLKKEIKIKGVEKDIVREKDFLKECKKDLSELENRLNNKKDEDTSEIQTEIENLKNTIASTQEEIGTLEEFVK